MTILGLCLLLILIGVILYYVNANIPMAASIKNLLNIVVVLGCLYLVLVTFGLMPYLYAPIHPLRISK